MLSNITLQNFKSFKNLDNLNIKPVTILCGTNSCGKSSILQSILLLKQTKESRSPNTSLLFNGKYVHLGDIENIVYGKNKDNILTLCYEYEFTTKQYYSTIGGTQRHTMPLFLRYLIPGSIERLKNVIHAISFTTEFRISDKNKGYIKTPDIHRYRISITSKTEEGEVIPGSFVDFNKKLKEYSLEWERLRHPHNLKTRNDPNMISGKVDGILVNFENLNPNIEFKKRPDDEFIDEIPFMLRNFIRATNDFLINSNEMVTYIGPLREEPSRRYIYENEVLEIGAKGENAAFIYQTEQETILKDHFFFDADVNTFTSKKELTLKKSLAKWLNLMNINGFSPDYQSEIIRLAMDSNSSKNTRVNIADVGFGVSQIFPILLEGLRMQKNGTLLLEQPEIHLHPSLQMQMADYFLSLALSEKNVIVETHSDHIINRLVRRIIEDDTFQFDKMVAIYFVSNTDEGAIIEEVVIDPTKGIINWPDGFFDQTASEQEKIMMAGIKKRKANRGEKKT